MRIALGQISCELKRPFDLSFLAAYGEPFVVFDQQQSGNLCFGVQGREGKLFLKVAGAETTRSCVAPEEAVRRMREASVVWRDLAHPALLRLLEDRPIAGGYLQVFEYFEGRCMGRQYDDHERFLRLPLEEKLNIYQTILEFHDHVNRCGYVAIDFYDGCVMYDFDAHETRLCDVEFYQRMPVINEMGRMWGSSRYMSPEEFTLGATIDERSNVYTMGQTAFQLLGGGTDYALGKWQASKALHTVALKAVKERREERYPSVGAYLAIWNETRKIES